MSDFDRYMALHLALGIDVNHRQDGDLHILETSHTDCCVACVMFSKDGHYIRNYIERICKHET
jgi:hypothetical protein